MDLLFFEHRCGGTGFVGLPYSKDSMQEDNYFFAVGIAGLVVCEGAISCELKILLLLFGLLCHLAKNVGDVDVAVVVL